MDKQRAVFPQLFGPTLCSSSLTGSLSFKQLYFPPFTDSIRFHHILFLPVTLFSFRDGYSLLLSTTLPPSKPRSSRPIHAQTRLGDLQHRKPASAPRSAYERIMESTAVRRLANASFFSGEEFRLTAFVPALRPVSTALAIIRTCQTLR